VLSGKIESEPTRIREIRESLTAAGNLTADPSLQSEVGSPVSGRIRELFVMPGARVLPGQPLARLNSPDVSKARSDLHHAQLRLKLAQSTLQQRRQRSRLGDLSQRPLEEAQNELSLAVAELEVASSDLALSKKKLARVKDLLDHGIATQQELEEARAGAEQAHSRWSQAHRQQRIAEQHKTREARLSKAGALVTLPIMEAENELQLAQEEVYHSRKVLEDLGVDSQGEGNGLFLRAPLGGIVVSSSARLGQAVSADQQLFEILDPSRLWLWVYLYESDQGLVSLGMPVTVTVATLAGKQFRGKISNLPPVVEIPTRTLKARVVVENPQGLLRVGMSAQAHIGLRAPRKALTVPVASIVQKDDDGSSASNGESQDELNHQKPPLSAGRRP